MMAGAAAMSALSFSGTAAAAAGPAQSFLEIKTWRLHNSAEEQQRRVSAYLEAGLFPALTRAGARPVGAFGNLIGDGGPYLVSLVQYRSLAAFEESLSKLEKDEAHTQAVQALDGGGSGVPYVRVESMLLRTLSGFPEAAAASDAKAAPRVFELRTYESQSLTALGKKIGMFNGGEIGIFERLGMRPIFFGEAIAGTHQPCIVYMLSFDNLAVREKLWAEFGSDAEWKRISAPVELKDAAIVGNIGNVMLRSLAFSPVR